LYTDETVTDDSVAILTVDLTDFDDAIEAVDKKVDDLTTLVGEIPTDTEGKAKADSVIAYAEKIAQEAKDAATYDDSALTARVKSNEDAITVLNGESTTEGSVSYKVAQAVASIVADAPEAYDTLKEIATWISTHSESASAMNEKIVANESAISDLEKLVGTLPEDKASDVETIVDYINSVVKGLSDGDIADLKTRVTKLEDVEAISSEEIEDLFK
jgi:hypothetical protein